MDYTTINVRVNISAGFTQVPVNIPIVDDKLQENVENFAVQIERIGEVTPAGVTVVTPNPTAVFITDNDG